MNCKIYYGDITKKESLSSVFENIDGKEVYVIHCAGVVYIKSKYNPIVYDVNVNGTKNIVDKVLEIDAKLIYVSSVHSITEKPNNETITEITNFDSEKVVGLYAKTKAEAAKYVIYAIKNKNLNACIIHPSGIIGPNDYGNSHLTQLIKEVATGKLFACVKGGYNFVDVRDVADGIISACDKNNRGECYILSNKYITIKELTDFVCDLEEKKRIKIVLPLWLAKLVDPICELYYNIKKQTPLFTKYSLYTLSSNSNFSNEKAKKEAALVAENEKLRANLLRTISHDLRTPLTAISGNASNLCSHYKILDDVTKEQIFSDIYDDSEWLIQLVENLLSVTRIEDGNMHLNKSLEVLDEVLDEAIKHIDRNKTEHQISVINNDEIVFAQMDAKLIMQVIINIVNNAIKYTQKGSKIQINYGNKGNKVYISISDNGPGLSDEMKKHVFEMFYTGQSGVADGKRSMGLGLALCKSVVEAHGGFIEVSDNIPSGCIFTFYIEKGEISINE